MREVKYHTKEMDGDAKGGGGPLHGLGGCSREYGSTSMRTTPLSSRRAPSTALVPFANSSSGSTEPREYAPMPIDTVPFDCSSAVPVSSVSVPVFASTRVPAAPWLMVPKPAVK